MRDQLKAGTCFAAAVAFALAVAGCDEEGTPPSIVSQPLDASAYENQRARFVVRATGSAPLSYSWEQSTDGGAAWTPVPGATGAALLHDAAYPADDGSLFRCVVGNGEGSAVSSDAVLTVTQFTTADFGDLDDSTFPTKLGTGSSPFGRPGPYHHVTGMEFVGPSPNTVTEEANALDPDGDADDATVSIHRVTAGGAATSLGMVSVDITTGADAATRFLNIAADLDNSGNFARYDLGGSFQHEWLVANMPICFVGQTRTVSATFRLADPVALAAFPPVRITLSTRPIDPAIFGDEGWDGSGPMGGFDRGETEDWLPGSSPTPAAPATANWQPYFPVPEYLLPDPNPNPNPNPNPPVSDPPGQFPHGGPASPPIVKVEDPESIFPEDDAPEPDPPMTAPEPVETQTDEPDLKRGADIDDMPDHKQPPGSYECGPTAAANSVQYLLDKAGILSTWQESGTPEGTPPPGTDPFDNIPKLDDVGGDLTAWEETLHERIKAGMSKAGGMMDDPEGTTTAGFRNGKAIASADLKEKTGQEIETTPQTSPSFESLYQAVKEGKDVEILMGFYDADKNRVGGHYVVVTGATEDENGNLTLTFTDPAAPPGQQTFTVSNRQGNTTGGGLVVNNYPCGNGRTAQIERMFAERIKSGS